jgi:hypothetical protein
VQKVALSFGLIEEGSFSPSLLLSLFGLDFALLQLLPQVGELAGRFPCQASLVLGHPPSPFDPGSSPDFSLYGEAQAGAL